MSESEDSYEFRKTLQKRGNILAAIEARPQTKPELVQSIGPSRSTIDRGVRDLEEINCIQRVDSQYHLTPLGELCYKEYQKYVNIMDNICSVDFVLNTSSDGAEISSNFLRRADVHIADPTLPESALQPSSDQLKKSERIIGLSPVAFSLHTGLIENFANGNGLETEFIIQRTALDSLLEYYRDSLEQLAQSENFSFHVTQDTLPYALWIMDQGEKSIAGITVYEKGDIQGVLTNDTRKAISWAHSKYEQYREEAMLISLHDEL